MLSSQHVTRTKLSKRSNRQIHRSLRKRRHPQSILLHRIRPRRHQLRQRPVLQRRSPLRNGNDQTSTKTRRNATLNGLRKTPRRRTTTKVVTMNTLFPYFYDDDQFIFWSIQFEENQERVEMGIKTGQTAYAKHFLLPAWIKSYGAQRESSTGLDIIHYRRLCDSIGMDTSNAEP